MSTSNPTPEILFKDGDTQTVLMDSISYVTDANRGDILISGSHGGTSSAGYAVSVRAAAAFFNDAGGGKNAAGISGLEMLQQTNIIAAAVSHETAEIGNAADTYANGIITHTNGLAERAGLKPRMRVSEAIPLLRSHLMKQK